MIKRMRRGQLAGLPARGPKKQTVMSDLYENNFIMLKVAKSETSTVSF